MFNLNIKYILKTHTHTRARKALFILLKPYLLVFPSHLNQVSQKQKESLSGIWDLFLSSRKQQDE